MDVSHETPAATEARLRRVIALAEMAVFEEPYVFEEFDARDIARRARPDALALVKDGDRCSQLVPASDDAGETFTVFSFHFPAGLDNSGFVGWLATHLKRTTGTGVFVLCGQNSARGGIFDYWGCPRTVGAAVIGEVRSLTGNTEASAVKGPAGKHLSKRDQ